MREDQWLNRPEWESVSARSASEMIGSARRVVVLSAHPDDETLGVGALVADLAADGVPVVAVVATAGEASHPEATVWRPEDLDRVRRAEIARAVDRLAPGATLVQWDYPDGHLPAAETDLVADLTGILRPDDLVLAPWLLDGHPDHDALGRTARAAADAVGAVLHHYPVWLWQWSEPDVVPWERAVLVEPTPAALAAKRAALREFPSQTGALGPGPGDAPVVGPSLLDEAHRVVEVLFAPSGPPPAASPTGTGAEPFDAMYADGTTDPWGFDASFYEDRKRRLVLATLGRPRYGRVLEIGCATGQLAADLATRADDVTAMDISPAALAVARRSDAPVRWVQGQAPEDVPDGPFDLVVLSEVGYFLTPAALLATFRRMRRALAPGGEIVLVDWRHPTRDVPLSGPLVHAQAATALAGLPHRAHYEDADVLIDLWGEPVSVAGMADGPG